MRMRVKFSSLESLQLPAAQALHMSLKISIYNWIFRSEELILHICMRACRRDAYIYIRPDIDRSAESDFCVIRYLAIMLHEGFMM